MLVTAMPTPSARIHEPTSAGVAPNASAAWKTNAAELVKPTSTATKPAATAANEMSLARNTEAGSGFAPERLLLRFEKGTPETKRIGDAAHRRKRIAPAGDDDRAEVEHASEHALLHLHTFDLHHIELDRVAADKAELGAHPFVGARESGRGVFDQRRNQDEESDHDQRQ